ncbi:GumC family protein [Rhizobium sp. L1K21]|uniref:GumC family protein n=1 Tax=Rhizobium sp. L1K21 TaxID=2954933 RepID=UPI0020939B13|nr:GumC family protein [Rhizobium sp. L1K21]MCO6185303.1 GumC family protein [Rhizobium sp. L1K21]
MSIDIFQLSGILWQRWYYAVAGMFLGILMGVAALLYYTPLYFASGQLIIDPAKLNAPIAAPVGSAAATEPSRELADSQAYLMGSRELRGEVVDRLHLENDEFIISRDGVMAAPLSATIEERRNAAIAGLMKVMTVERENQSLVFTIGAKHPVSKTAADLVNTLADVYLEHSRNYRLQTAERSASTMHQQAENMRKRLNAAKQAVEDFKAEHGLFSTGGRGLLQDQSLEALNTQLAAAREDAASKQAVYDEARKLSVEDVEAGTVAGVVQSTALDSLRARYAQFLDTQAQLSANLGANHPRLKAAASQATSMRRSIESELSRVRESLKNDYLVARSKVAALEKEFDAASKAAGDSAELKTQLAELESQATALETLYQSTLSGAEGLSQQEESDVGTARIISAAVPPREPKNLPKGIVLAAAAMFGFAAGCGLAILQYLVASLSAVRRASPASNVADQRYAGAAIPVVARIKADIEPGPASNLVRFPRQANGRKAGQAQHLRDMSIMRIAYILETAATEAEAFEEAYRILFISLAGGHIAGFDLRGIASALSARADVWISDDQVMAAAKPAIARSGGVKISLQSAPVAVHDEWQGVSLPFEQIHDGYFENTDRFTPAIAMVDACGTRAEKMMPVLLRSCDAVVVVADQAGATGAALNEMGQLLEPWQDKVLGCVVVEPS